MRPSALTNVLKTKHMTLPEFLFIVPGCTYRRLRVSSGVQQVTNSYMYLMNNKCQKKDSKNKSRVLYQISSSNRTKQKLCKSRSEHHMSKNLEQKHWIYRCTS